MYTLLKKNSNLNLAVFKKNNRLSDMTSRNICSVVSWFVAI